MEATYSHAQVAPFPHWVQPFAQLARALGSRDNAVAYVELGGDVASYIEMEWAVLQGHRNTS
jgi:hypothetical protein